MANLNASRIAVSAMLTLSITGSAAEGMRDLIGLADGQTVYFRMRSGYVEDSWYKAKYSPVTGTTLEKAKRPYISDVSADGSVEATAYLLSRFCAFNNGSSCLTQPGCRASATLWGDEWSAIASAEYETTVRLNHSGNIAWIDQNTWCPSAPYTQMSPRLQGLFDTRTMRPMAQAGGYILANRNMGRRSITTGNKALVRHRGGDGGLAWLSAAPAATTSGNLESVVPTQETALEAVTNADGCVIGYNTLGVNEVRLVELCGVSSESRGDAFLGFRGTSLCMSDNGRYLAAIAPGSSQLIVYDRVRDIWSDSLISEPVERITMGGAALFASTRRNSLLRMDLDSGDLAEIVPPIPEVDRVFAARQDDAGGCQPCYGTPPWRFLASDGMYVFLQGRSLTEPGWQVELNGRETTLNGLPGRMASIEFREESRSGVTAVFRHPAIPAISISLLLTPFSGSFACIATEHEGEDARPVTFEDPARVGERVRIRTAGLDPAKPPPSLGDPGAATIVSFGADPQVKGMQVLELEIRRPFAMYTILFAPTFGPSQCGGAPPIQAAR